MPCVKPFKIDIPLLSAVPQSSAAGTRHQLPQSALIPALLAHFDKSVKNKIKAAEPRLPPPKDPSLSAQTDLSVGEGKTSQLSPQIWRKDFNIQAPPNVNEAAGFCIPE